MTISLDIGCGLNPKNTFDADTVWGIDIRGEYKDHIKIADLVVEPIPFEDNYFDYVTAYDFIEHVPRVIYNPSRRFPFVELMNEIYRVLKTDGLFFSFTPAFPRPAAFRDPTHVNIITEETFPLYFDNTNRLASMYGFSGAFKILKQEWTEMHLISLMKKVELRDYRLIL